MLILVALAGTAVAGIVAAQPVSTERAAEIIRQSIQKNEADWRAEPLYDHCERDDDGKGARTYDVTMIEGTPYKRLVAVNGRRLSASSARIEQLKLERATVERRMESPSARRQRLSGYRQRHMRIRSIVAELARAFTFALDGRTSLESSEVYVLNATPRPDYDPPTRDARALIGMHAVFWVDRRTHQWIRVSASVARPVSVVGFHFVRIEPGTTVEIEKVPVEANVWLTTHLRITSSSRIVFVLPHHTFYDERDFEYRRTSAHVASACE